jgi:serine dehydrogenase proteinase
LRPGKRKRRSTLGSNGCTRLHNASETIHGATAIGTPPSLTTDADGVRRQGTGPFILMRVLKAAASRPLARRSFLTAPQAKDLQALGLQVQVGVDDGERELLSLYPQPRGRTPAVEYVPGTPPDRTCAPRWRERSKR